MSSDGQPVNLPARSGPRPRTTPHAPHSQVDQLVPPVERRRLGLAVIARAEALADISLGPSRRAPPGSVGFYLDEASCCPNPDAFLLGREIAHVHLEDDGSLHAVLPPDLHRLAIERGWAEPHPMAGMPTVSPRTVMLYAPRDDHEVDVIAGLVLAAWRAARVVSERVAHD